MSAGQGDNPEPDHPRDPALGERAPSKAISSRVVTSPETPPISRGRSPWLWPLRVAVATGTLFVVLVLAVNALLLLYPRMPITVSVRPSFDGSSLVAQFHNTSNRFLAVRVTCQNRDLGQARTFVLSIGPGQTSEIGWLQGWKFASGESVVLTHADYRRLRVTIP